MKPLENMARLGVLGIGVGLGLALAAPFIGGGPAERRRILKGLVRRWYGVQESVRETVAEAGEQLSDLAAEVRAERAAGRVPEPHQLRPLRTMSSLDTDADRAR